MHSITEIFTIGNGPSSSHTMGPRKAADVFLEKIPDVEYYRVTLYGSLAATGRGHLTDLVLKDVFRDKKFDLLCEPKIFLPRHPNALKFQACIGDSQLISEWTVYGIGGKIIDDNYSEKLGILNL